MLAYYMHIQSTTVSTATAAGVWRSGMGKERVHGYTAWQVGFEDGKEHVQGSTARQVRFEDVKEYAHSAADWIPTSILGFLGPLPPYHHLSYQHVSRVTTISTSLDFTVCHNSFPGCVSR